MFDSDCPVKPPCYCTDSVTTSQKASSGTKQWTADLDHRDDVVLVVAQRIACDEFPEVRRPRRKWSQRPGSKAGSRSRPRTRFPRFVESNVAVKRHVLLSYSGLTAIPGAAFHALKVRLHCYDINPVYVQPGSKPDSFILIELLNCVSPTNHAKRHF